MCKRRWAVAAHLVLLLVGRLRLQRREGSLYYSSDCVDDRTTFGFGLTHAVAVACRVDYVQTCAVGVTAERCVSQHFLHSFL